MSELSQAAGILTGTAPQEPAEERTEPVESPEAEESPATGQAEPESADTPESGQEAEPEKAWESWMYDLEIPGTDGLTAGQFKDRIKELHQADEIRAQADIVRQDAQREALEAQETLTTLVSDLGLQFTPEQIQQAQASKAQKLEQNERLAAERIEGWDDAATRAQDQQGIKDLMSQYMFSPTEAEMAKDWRFQWMVNDHAKLRARVNAALSGEVKPKADQKPRVNRKVTGESNPVADFKAGKLNEAQAVTALLSGSKQ